MTVFENLQEWIEQVTEKHFDSLQSLILFEIEGVYGSRLDEEQVKELLRLGREKRDELEAEMKPQKIKKNTKQKSLF